MNAHALLRAIGAAVELSAAERNVLRVLVGYFGDDGVAWPAVATIARDAGMHHDSARRTLRSLTAAGVLEVVTPGGGDRRSTTVRRIVPEVLATHTPGASARGTAEITTDSPRAPAPTPGASARSTPGASADHPGRQRRLPRAPAPPKRTMNEPGKAPATTTATLGAAAIAGDSRTANARPKPLEVIDLAAVEVAAELKELNRCLAGLSDDRLAELAARAIASEPDAGIRSSLEMLEHPAKNPLVRSLMARILGAEREGAAA